MKMSRQQSELQNSEAGEGLFASTSPVYVSPSSPVGSPTSLPSSFSFDTSRQEREWRQSLASLEKEIDVLQNTLAIKSREAAELRRKLGMTRINELKEGMLHGYQSFKESEPVVKTNAALKSVGDFASRKLSNIRNSTAFKSVGERVEGAYSSVRGKLLSTKSEGGTSELEGATASAPPVEAEEKDFGEKVPL